MIYACSRCQLVSDYFLCGCVGRGGEQAASGGGEATDDDSRTEQGVHQSAAGSTAGGGNSASLRTVHRQRSQTTGQRIPRGLRERETGPPSRTGARRQPRTTAGLVEIPGNHNNNNNNNNNNNGLTLVPWQSSKALCWDVTVTCPLSDSYVAGAAREAGSAAELAAARKEDKYSRLTADTYLNALQ